MFFRVKIQLRHVTSHCVSSPMCINAANASGASTAATAATAEGCVVWFVDFQESWIWTKDGGFCISKPSREFCLEWSEYETRCRSLKRTVTHLMKKSGSFFQVFFLTRFFEVEPTLQCKKYARLPSCFPGGRGGGDTPIHYLYGYVPPNGVVILERGIHFRGVC